MFDAWHFNFFLFINSLKMESINRDIWCVCHKYSCFGVDRYFFFVIMFTGEPNLLNRKRKEIRKLEKKAKLKTVQPQIHSHTKYECIWFLDTFHKHVDYIDKIFILNILRQNISFQNILRQ